MEDEAMIYERATNQTLIDASDNIFVEDINGNNFVYAKDFYIALYKKLESGLSPVAAYEALGFDTSKLGKNRAFSAARRAKELGSRNGFTIDPGNYDGSVSRDQMGELNKDEELAYMKARTLYLESMLELQKKIPSILEEARIYLKQEK